MIEVAGVRFKAAGKVYYFDPNELPVEKDSEVIVETARGLEFGYVTSEIKKVHEEKIVAPLKKIVRIATEEDVRKHAENEQKKEKAMKLCQEKIDKRGLEMKLVDVEYTFDNSKVIFYFTADGRVDFRELVKDLASVFRMRIELRQIGVRDESKMMGGIANCGRPLCCHSWLSDFEPVSIKMAKVQNLSLNPGKISGVCGRLMCCLKYENDTYNELRRGMPDAGETVITPDGKAIVTDTSILESKVKVRHILNELDEDGKNKLSADICVYDKEEIKRLGKRKKEENVFENIDKETMAEIENLLKD